MGDSNGDSSKITSPQGWLLARRQPLRNVGLRKATGSACKRRGALMQSCAVSSLKAGSGGKKLVSSSSAVSLRSSGGGTAGAAGAKHAHHPYPHVQSMMTPVRQVDDYAFGSGANSAGSGAPKSHVTPGRSILRSKVHGTPSNPERKTPMRIRWWDRKSEEDDDRGGSVVSIDSATRNMRSMKIEDMRGGCIDSLQADAASAAEQRLTQTPSGTPSGSEGLPEYRTPESAPVSEALTPSADGMRSAIFFSGVVQSLSFEEDDDAMVSHRTVPPPPAPPQQRQNIEGELSAGVSAQANSPGCNPPLHNGTTGGSSESGLREDAQSSVELLPSPSGPGRTARVSGKRKRRQPVGGARKKPSSSAQRSKQKRRFFRTRSATQRPRRQRGVSPSEKWKVLGTF